MRVRNMDNSEEMRQVSITMRSEEIKSLKETLRKSNKKLRKLLVKRFGKMEFMVNEEFKGKIDMMMALLEAKDVKIATQTAGIKQMHTQLQLEQDDIDGVL